MVAARGRRRGRGGCRRRAAAVSRRRAVVATARRQRRAPAAASRDEEQAGTLGHARHCSQVLSFSSEGPDYARRWRAPATSSPTPSRPATPVAVPTQLPFAEWVCLTPDHPEGVPRLGARHDARPRRRARPDLDAEPTAHLPGDRRPRRQGPDHPHRPGRRPRPRPGHPRRHPGRPTPRQASGSTPRSSTCATCAPSCSSSCSCATGPASTTSRCSPPSRQLFDPTIDALTSTHPDDDLVDLWRRESARAVRRFLDQALHPPGQHAVGQARAAAQRPQPAPRHRHRRPPRRGDVHRQGRARRRSTVDRSDHQGRRRRPRPRARRRRRRDHQVDRGDRRQGTG